MNDDRDLDVFNLRELVDYLYSPGPKFSRGDYILPIVRITEIGPAEAPERQLRVNVPYGPWGGVPVPDPSCTPVSDDEAVSVMLETVGGKYWAESWQGKLKRMRDAGYVIAKVKT